MSLRALVIGLAQIRMGYDLHHDPEQFILTHARSFQIHPNFELVGGVDSDVERVRLFEAKYERSGYTDLTVALHDLYPEVVAIATPTAQHYQTINAVLNAIQPQAILCEKPLAYHLDQAITIVKDCESHQVSLYVNYMRRSDPGVAEIRARINDNRIAQPIKGVCWYSKGLFNNGSHFLNLLQHWLGEVIDIHVLNQGRWWNDSDPEPDLRFNFKFGTVFFLAAREENYSHYTIELVASNGRLRYEQGGEKILWQSVTANSTCKGYQILNPVPEMIASDLDHGQWQVADHLSASLAGREARICSGQEALRTLDVLNQIVQNL